jgi:DNA-binding NtrC family response regulator
MLGGAGYECSLSCTHEAIPEALKQASNCDLVVCQVAALEKEEEFLNWALGAGKDVPIVATAGRAPGYLPKFVLERCSFLQGPFEKDQLLSIVRDTIENHNSQALYRPSL